MLPLIENLLILQDRDRKLLRLRAELSKVEPERRMMSGKSSQSQTALENAKTRAKQVESERKRLELEAEGKKQQIGKYATQQLQTKKNEEYRALTNEIAACRRDIRDLEDQQLEVMTQAEAVQKEVAAATKVAAQVQQDVDRQLAELATREQAVKKQLAELESGRGALASAVEETALNRYERLLKNKGENVIVGVEHGVCGGCHMKLPTQILVTIKGTADLLCCPNCGRILYYRRDMDMTVKD